MMPMSGMSSGMGGPGTSPPRRRQAPPVEHTLNLSLEELYEGSSKRMRITKKVSTADTFEDWTEIVLLFGLLETGRARWFSEGALGRVNLALVQLILVENMCCNRLQVLYIRWVGI